MRSGPLGLPELPVIISVLVPVVGVGGFLLRSLALLVREQRKKRRALERIAEHAPLQKQEKRF